MVDCWNQIGVQGNRSCVELKEHVHCRNCPVYSMAARTILDREPTEAYRPDWNQTAVPTVANGHTESVLIFRIGSEWLALPTTIVQEVAELRPIHSLPHRRTDILLGLANVRGELLVCVSLDRMLGIEPEPDKHRDSGRAEQRRLLVMRREGVRAVCPVDEVHGTHRAQSRELKEAPATVAKGASSHTKALLPWRERSVGVLDARLVFLALQRSLA